MPVSTHLSRYVGPTEVHRSSGKMYLYDAGSGELIAEIDADAAASIRQHNRVDLTFDVDADGDGYVGKADH